jgi:hypothetical protein
MTKVKKLTVNKMAFTTSGGAGTVVKVEGSEVTLSGMFGDFVVQLDEVYHSRATAWGGARAI